MHVLTTSSICSNPNSKVTSNVVLGNTAVSYESVRFVCKAVSNRKELVPDTTAVRHVSITAKENT